MSRLGYQTLVNLSIRTRTFRNALVSRNTSTSSIGEDKEGGTACEKTDKTAKKLRAKTPIGKMIFILNYAPSILYPLRFTRPRLD